MITTFGKFCRILRIKHNQLLKNMADALEVSSAFLSAVENGKKEIPSSWYEKIKSIYSLDENEANQLSTAIDVSKKEYRINLENIATEDRALALSFARKLEAISQMDAKTKNELRSFLERTTED